MAQNWTQPPPSGAPVNIPSYLLISILALIFCFPTGIFALKKAASVNRLIAAGDVQGAMKASTSARNVAFITVGISVAIILFCLLAVGVALFSGGTPRTR